VLAKIDGDEERKEAQDDTLSTISIEGVGEAPIEPELSEKSSEEHKLSSSDNMSASSNSSAQRTQMLN